MTTYWYVYRAEMSADRRELLRSPSRWLLHDREEIRLAHSLTVIGEDACASFGAFNTEAEAKERAALAEELYGKRCYIVPRDV